MKMSKEFHVQKAVLTEFQNCQKVAFHSRKRSVYSTPIFNLRQCNCTGCVLVIRSTYVQIGATQLKRC